MVLQPAGALAQMLGQNDGKRALHGEALKCSDFFCELHANVL
jgi:hypothetical protein